MGVDAKICMRCRTVKPFGEFHRCSGRSDGLQGWCKACQSARHLETRPVRLAQARASYHRNRAKAISDSRAWAKANPEKVRAAKLKWREQNVEALRAARLAWKRANPERNRLHYHRWRSLKWDAAGASYTTPDLIEARIAFYGGCCRYCGDPWESIDHRIPLSRGGSHWPANLVPVCVSCNSRKNDRTEREYLDVLAREGVKPSLYVHLADPIELRHRTHSRPGRVPA